MKLSRAANKLSLMQLQKIHFATKTPDDDPLCDLLSDLVCLHPNSLVELELLDNALSKILVTTDVTSKCRMMIFREVDEKFVIFSLF